MLTTQEMQEIKSALLQDLPQALVEDPAFNNFIREVAGEMSPSKEDFAGLSEALAEFRFEAGQRFDHVEGRFDHLEGRFDRQEGRLESLYTRMKGAEERLGEFNLEMKYARRDIARNGSQLSYVIRRMDGLEAWIKAIEGKKGSDKGQNLEETFATALRFGLQNADIKPENIRLRVKLTDSDGLVYQRGHTTEVDIIIEDRRWTAFEIKASAEKDDVTSFWFKLKLIRLQQPDKEIRGVIFSCRDDAELKECCRDYEIELIEPFTTLTKYEMEEEPLPPELADLPPENEIPPITE
ncbi:MAG: hypothetical protein ACREEM_07800 [Blastocatellia bacterium]